MAELSRAISEDGSVVVSVIDGRDIVEEMRRIHNTSPVITAALGRLSLGASLIGIGLKGERDSVTLRIKGGGEAGLLLAVSDSMGNVRSYVEEPGVDLPLSAAGKLDVGKAVGKEGTLSVIKDMGLKEPYIGQTALVSGEIAEDIASYYAHSEQVPTVCGLGVLVDRDRSVKAAGGYLIQLLPFADPSCIDVLEKNIADLPPITQLLDAGKTAGDIAHACLSGLSPQDLDAFEVSYLCDCTAKRVERALISLGAQELKQLSLEQPVAEIRCQFCDRVYSYTSQQLMDLIP